MASLELGEPETDWGRIVEWAGNNWKGRSLKVITCKLGFGATLYQFWKL